MLRFHYLRGMYAVVTDEDPGKARPHLAKAIDIICFINEEDIDAIYLGKPCSVVPAKGAEKTYKLVVKAFKDT